MLVNSDGDELQVHKATSETKANSLESTTQEGDDEDFQPVIRRRNKGKTTTPCSSLPNVINTRQAYKASLTKFAPLGNMSKVEMDKPNMKDKGSGGAPQSSSSKV